MKTFSELTKEQQKFIKKWIPGFFERNMYAAKRQEYKEIVDAYGNYEALAASFRVKSGEVPDDHAARGRAITFAEAAEQEKENGRFDAANQLILQAIAEIDMCRDAIKQERDDMIRVCNIRIADLSDVDSARMDAARQAVLNNFNHPYPSRAALDQAQAAMAVLDQAFAAAAKNLQRLPAAQALFDLLEQRVQPKLDLLTPLAPDTFQGTTQETAIEAMRDVAVDLDADLRAADRNNPAILDGLATRLRTFDNNDPQPLIDQAMIHLRTDLQNVLNNNNALQDVILNTLVNRFQALACHDTLKNTQLGLVGRLSNLSVAARNGNWQEVKTQQAAAPQFMTDARAFQQDVEAAEEELLRAELTAQGTTAPHIDGLVALKAANPAAGDKLIATLAQNATALGGQAPTFAFTRQTKAEIKRLEGEETPLKDDRDAAFELKQEKEEDVRLARRALLTEQNKPGGGDLGEIARLTQAKKAAKRQRAAARQDLQMKEALLDAKQDDIAAEKKKLANAEAQRTLLDALTFGPLSPNARNPLPADEVETIIDIFGQSPALAMTTCKALQSAKDRSSLIELAGYLGDQVTNGFEWTDPLAHNAPPEQLSDERAEKYAKDLVQRAAFFGQDYATEAQVAITAGTAYHDNPDIRNRADGKTRFSEKEMAAIRSQQAASSMMQTDPVTGNVTLDLDSGVFNEVLARQKFSEDGFYQSGPMMTAEMDKLKAFFHDPTDGAARRQEAEQVLNAITTPPTSATATDFLKQSMGLSDAEYNAKSDEDKIALTRQAIMKSMCTPLTQGDVGSCFATGPLRRLRDERPLDVMKMYAEIIETGTLTGKNTGAAVPAVRNVQPEDDPLVRSLEYTVASAAGRDAQMQLTRVVNEASIGTVTKGPFDALKTTLRADYTAFHHELKALVEAKYTVSYDPLAATALGADGSSDQGIWRIVDTSGGGENPIKTKDEFRAFMKARASEALTDAGLDPAHEANIHAYIDSPAFTTEVENLAYEDYLPWNMPGGGGALPVLDVIVGTTPAHAETEVMAAGAAGAKRGDRAVALLKEVVALPNDKMTGMQTPGHVFNALPAEGRVNDLHPATLDQDIKTHLLDPAKELHDNPMPSAQAARMYDRMVDEYAAKFPEGSNPRAEVEKVFGDRPTGDMTPEQLMDHLSDKLEDIWELRAQTDANLWATAQTTPVSAAEKQQRHDETKAKLKAEVEKGLAAKLVFELDAPEFPIADTNWGSEADSVYYVVAPNPLTGEPDLWQKHIISGKLVLMRDTDINGKWSTVQ